MNDTLGQVSHIFTDKTGTLTSNKMKFNRLLVGMYEFAKERKREEMNESQIVDDARDKAFLGMLAEDSPDG